MTSLPQRVAARHLEKTAMAVLLRNVASHDWGFFSREDKRMHLQTVEEGAREHGKIKFWLENKGQRTFEVAAGSLNGKEIKALERKVKAERAQLESRWVTFMVRKTDWISAKLKGSTVVITAYPSTHNSFIREIDLRRLFGGAYGGNETSWDARPPLVDFDSSNGLLAVGPEKRLDDREHIDVSEYLFVD